MADKATNCQELGQLSKEELVQFFNSFDTVLTDCDGVLWSGPEAIPGSPEMIGKFRELGKHVVFVTNNAAVSRKKYVEKCQSLGFGGTFVSNKNDWHCNLFD